MWGSGLIGDDRLVFGFWLSSITPLLIGLQDKTEQLV